MNTLISALAGDIISRFISSLVAKYQNQRTEDKLERLQWLLLRARAIVEEAEGRHISNQGMLMQLRQLVKDIYRGYYMLDTFKGLHTTDAERHTAVRQSYNLKKLQIALDSLESTIGDMKEFLVFLLDCPRIPRQPYSTYLFMERCMFGRHLEREQIISFLLQPCKSSLGVLPIIGPREVGKRTLVEFVCNEQRVREHFSQIVHVSSIDLSDLGIGTPIKPQEPIAPNMVRSLIVVELVHDIDDATWRRFYSSIFLENSDSSKVIIISRMEKASILGTVPVLRLKRLRQHEFWYFFRTLAFGSANPEEYQELCSLAKKIVTHLKGLFISANVLARLLRANLDIHFWRQISELVKKAIQWHFLVCGEDAWGLISKSRPFYFSNYVDDRLLLCYSAYKTAGCLTKRELPKITAEGIITGSITIPSDGNFELLRWQSPIPPYYSYVENCVVKKAPQIVPKEKCIKRRRGL